MKTAVFRYDAIDRLEEYMKEEKMLRAFSLVDDDLVEKAAPKEQKPKMPFWWKRLAYVAFAACLMIAVVLPNGLHGW